MKLKPAYETEIYISAGGYAAIKQDNGLGDTAIVVLNASQSRIIANELLRLADKVEQIEKRQQRTPLRIV